MSGTFLFLADVDTPDLVAKGAFVSATTRDWLITFGAISLLTLVLVAIVWIIRGRRNENGGRRRSHHHHHHHESTSDSSAPASGDEEQGHRRRKWRRRRREHRPRNPTLAETGGLPPIRPQGPPGSLP